MPFILFIKTLIHYFLIYQLTLKSAFYIFKHICKHTELTFQVY